MLLPEVHVDEPITISAAAELLGITVDTIRYYEKEGSRRLLSVGGMGGDGMTRRRSAGSPGQ